MVDIPASAGIVLDLDDTLYSERQFHESGFRWIARRTGLDPEGSEVAAACRELRAPGGRPLDVLSRATKVPVAQLLEWHRGHTPEISLFSDAAAFLARAGERDMPMVLLTDGRSATQRNKVEALGIAACFRTILVSEETGVDKFHPGSFEGAGGHLDDRVSITSIGDNPEKDVYYPVALGWQTVLIRHGRDNVHNAPWEVGAGVSLITTLGQVRFV